MKVSRIKLKYVATINDDVLPAVTSPDREVRYVDISNVDSDGTIGDGEVMRFGDAPSRARRLVRDGDVVVSTVRTYLRAIAPVVDPDPDLVVSTGFAVVRPRSGLNPRFAAYALRDSRFVEDVVANSEGVAYPGISPTKLAGIPVAMTPLSLQAAVSGYLDREMARIDALIDRKQRFIGLLLEKRTSMITDVVTRGLDPTAATVAKPEAMLDRVPVHWRAHRFRWLVRKGRDFAAGPFGSNIGTALYVDEGVPVIRGVNLTLGGDGPKFRDTGFVYVTEQSADSLSSSEAQPGDLVFTARGTVGAVGLVPLDGPARYILSANQTRFRPNSVHLSAAFLWYQFSSRWMLQQTALEGESVAQPNMNLGDLKNLWVVVPPLSEQQAIAAYLDQHVAKVDALIHKTRQSIDLLKEYRTALISAAVTGQIDIPGIDETEDVA